MGKFCRLFLFSVIFLCISLSRCKPGIKPKPHAENVFCSVSANDYWYTLHTLNVATIFNCDSDTAIGTGAGSNIFAVHRFGSKHPSRYRLGLLKDTKYILSKVGWTGELVKFPDAEFARIPICSSTFRPKNEVPHEFTTDFKWQTVGESMKSRSIEVIMIEGFEKKHAFVLDVNSTSTKCSQWTPRRLFMLDLPIDCLKGNVRTLPKSAFKGDEIEVATKLPYNGAFNPDFVQKKCWIYISSHYQKRYTSQGEQDGLLEYIFSQIGTTNKYAVEFGYDGQLNNGKNGANTYHLVEKHGFNVLLMDGGYENRSINLHKEIITPQNIVDLFVKYKVPRTPDYVSIDIDSTDLWIFRALLSDSRGYRPRIISVEYNINFPLESTITCSDQCPPFKCKLFGSSFGALHMVAEEFNYTLVGVVELLDMFFVRNEDLIVGNTAEGVPIPAIKPSIEFYRSMTGKPYLRRTCFEKLGNDGNIHIYNYTRDYKMWLDSNFNETVSRESGLLQLKKLSIKL